MALPTELLPLYKVLDGDSLDELEDEVTRFIQQHVAQDHEFWLSGPPQLIKDETGDEYFIQAVGAYKNNV